ncbi:MAG: hypothetical protein Q8Q33_06910, partial [Chlamydiota bacterium]|nr:hypothetical protein [Chlamydiota bacterium]
MLGRLIRVFILGMLTIMVVGHLGINILLNQPDLKATVQEKIADKFGINLHFSDIDYDLYRGISLDHIQIKGEDAGKYFDLDIDKIRINIALHELLFRRCVIEELDIINSVFFISPTPRTAAKEKQGQVSSEVPLKKGTSQIRKDQSQLKSKGKEIRAKKPWLFTLQNINIAHTVVYIQSQPIALELENIR